MPACMAGEERSRHGRNLEQDEAGDKTEDEQTRHERNEMLGDRSTFIGSARQIGDEQVAHYAHGGGGDNFVELKADESLEPSPKQKFCFVEDHPRNEHRAEQANDRCADCPVGDDDPDECRENATG